MIVEPLVQGAAGMLVHPPGYLRAVRELCERHGVLLICDEVATGFGRTGTMFACEQEGVAPDLLCLAKGLTGGYLPLAATLATERDLRGFLGAPEEQRTFFHGHTYTGNPLACAAALANLEAFDSERTLERLQPKIAPARRAAGGGRGDCRGGRGAPARLHGRHRPRRAGPALGLGHRVTMEARERGAIIRPLGDVVVLMPPLSISEDDLRQLVAIAAESIQAASARLLRPLNLRRRRERPSAWSCRAAQSRRAGSAPPGCLHRPIAARWQAFRPGAGGAAAEADRGRQLHARGVGLPRRCRRSERWGGRGRIQGLRGAGAFRGGGDRASRRGGAGAVLPLGHARGRSRGALTPGSSSPSRRPTPRPARWRGDHRRRLVRAARGAGGERRRRDGPRLPHGQAARVPPALQQLRRGDRRPPRPRGQADPAQGDRHRLENHRVVFPGDPATRASSGPAPVCALPETAPIPRAMGRAQRCGCRSLPSRPAGA